MSPRSAEFLRAAERRLALARRAIGDDAAGALSAAYYAMLYAARAALSEQDRYAKTHAGTWHEFRETFVASGLFDAELVAGRRGFSQSASRPIMKPGSLPRPRPGG